jgi:hypothetical protein
MKREYFEQLAERFNEEVTDVTASGAGNFRIAAPDNRSTIRYPDRYMDKRGKAFFDKVIELIK